MGADLAPRIYNLGANKSRRGHHIGKILPQTHCPDCLLPQKKIEKCALSDAFSGTIMYIRRPKILENLKNSQNALIDN